MQMYEQAKSCETQYDVPGTVKVKEAPTKAQPTKSVTKDIFQNLMTALNDTAMVVNEL